MASKKKNKALTVVLVVGGAAVLVYLLTRKTATPQPVLTVSNATPISSSQALENTLISKLPNIAQSLENYF